MIINGNSDKRMMILEKGQKIIEALTEYARTESLRGGQISGIGAICDVELGYYDLEKKDYDRRLFSSGDFELISMNGNFSLKDGEPYPHLHISMGGPNFQVLGGHLFEAKVAVTVEMFVDPLGTMPQRSFDDCLGLALIKGRV